MDGIPIPHLEGKKKKKTVSSKRVNFTANYAKLSPIISLLNVNEFRKMSPELKLTKWCVVKAEIFLKRTAPWKCRWVFSVWFVLEAPRTLANKATQTIRQQI